INIHAGFRKSFENGSSHFEQAYIEAIAVELNEDGKNQAYLSLRPRHIGVTDTENNSPYVIEVDMRNCEEEWKVVKFADKWSGNRPGIGYVESSEPETDSLVKQHLLSRSYLLWTSSSLSLLRSLSDRLRTVLKLREDLLCSIYYFSWKPRQASDMYATAFVGA